MGKKGKETCAKNAASHVNRFNKWLTKEILDFLCLQSTVDFKTHNFHKFKEGTGFSKKTPVYINKIPVMICDDRESKIMKMPTFKF